MLALLLVGCVHLDEGDYDVDYDAPDVDSCDLLDGQAQPDTQGDLDWYGDRFTFDPDDGDSRDFDVDGRAFEGHLTPERVLDANCQLRGDEDDAGEITSATSVEGTSEILYVLEGACGMWQAILDTPCSLEFDWSAELDA